jgi:hypothetical protein
VRFPRSIFQPPDRTAGRADRGGRDGLRALVGITSIVILAGGFLSGCRIEPLAPTAELSPTIAPTAEQPLASLLPTLDEVTTKTPAPTATLTPMVTRPAAAVARIFYDALDDNSSGWTLRKTEVGSAAFANGWLVFTVSAPYTSLSSTLPNDFPSDIYIEVTAQTMLCGAGVDTFGIIFRNRGDHSYRFAVTCRGQLRMERYTGNTLDGASGWQATLGLLQGAPATNQISVLLQGSNFRFFVNGAEVFSTHDPVNASGGVGLFVESEKSQMLSVGFDNLAVYSVASSQGS